MFARRYRLTLPWEFGILLFDRLEPSVRLALMAEVGWALLRDTESPPPLTAINESVIGVLFCDMELCIEIEIDSEDEVDQPYFWRNRVLAVYREIGEADDLPNSECTDNSEWSILVEALSDRILWDNDFNDGDEYLDMPPEESRYMKYVMGIADDYFRAVPPDPIESDLPRIRAMVDDLVRE